MGIQATDKNRTLFLKGFKLSDQGKNEDPTYLGFKFVFDFGVLPIDPEWGWAPSPLLRINNYTQGNGAGMASGLQNPFGQPAYQLGGGPIYYSAYNYLLQREGAFVGTSNQVKRAQALKQFQVLLNDINSNSPWFFQSIEGLNELEKIKISGFQPEGGNDDFNVQRTAGKALTINCLESINLRISALANLYNQAVFDADNMRWLVPRNMRKFTMWIFVTEIRNFYKTSRLTGSSTVLAALDNLSSTLTTNRNPGSNIQVNDTGQYSVDGYNLSDPVENVSGNPGNSFTSFVSNVFEQSGVQSDVQAFRNQSDQSGIKPVLIYECQQCEFDFSESTPLKSSVDNGSSTADPVTQSFKIYVGKVRMKNQYPNIRVDKKPLILADGAYQDRTSVYIYDDSLSVGRIASLANELITNFTSAAINDLVNEGVNQFVNPLLSGVNQSLLGNIYSFNPSQLGRLTNQNGNFAFNNAQNFLNGAAETGIDNIFKGNLPNPQTMGLGGPQERAYPPISPPEDLYPKVPGTDQGVPDRVYPAPGGDVYTNVPGTDLGVPDRVYPVPGGDVYGNVPGTDLGVPDRVYPTPGGDVYDKVPGSDLGVPDRAYPVPGGDAYANVPGSDLGVPDRNYSSPPLGDAYGTVPGSDLGVPDRIYPQFNEDVYTDTFIPDSLNPEVVYPPSQLQNIGGELRSPENSFSSPPAAVYQAESLSYQRGEIGKVYPPTLGDFIIDPPLNLGNNKPSNKFNPSLGTFNPDPAEEQ